MKKKLTTIIIFACLAPVIGFAQKSNAEEEILSSQQLTSEVYILNSNQANVANAAFISIEGDDNTFTGSQQNTGSTQNPNIIAVMQSGNLNNVQLNQTGEGNKSTVNQLGEGNDYEGRLDGRSILTNVNQFGNNNEINQAVSGEDLNFKITQQGNNNEIHHINNGQNSREIEVTQRGSNMNITITNGY